MSENLIIRPLRERGQLQVTDIWADEFLKFDQDYCLMGQIFDLSSRRDNNPEIPKKPTIKTHPLPPHAVIVYHDEDGIRSTRQDCEGNDIVFAFAKDLKKLRLPRGTSRKNRAISAFIQALPGNTPIVLEWS